MASPQDELPPGSVDFVLHIVDREEWKARDWPLKEKLKNLPKLPYKLVLDHFTDTEPCTTYDECVRAVQTMQEKDMARGYNDIRFNFLIGGDGRIYEGRGWHVCASRSMRNFIKIWRRRLDVAFIGDYTEQPIPDLMMQRFHECIDFGIKEDIVRRFPVCFHVRKGIQVLPVEGTMDDFVGNALKKIKKREDEANVVLQDKIERENAIKERMLAEDIEEGRVKKPKPREEEIPYSDCGCESHHKKAQEMKTFKEIRNRMKDELWKTREIYRT